MRITYWSCSWPLISGSEFAAEIHLPPFGALCWLGLRKVICVAVGNLAEAWGLVLSKGGVRAVNLECCPAGSCLWLCQFKGGAQRFSWIIKGHCKTQMLSMRQSSSFLVKQGNTVTFQRSCTACFKQAFVSFPLSLAGRALNLTSQSAWFSGESTEVPFLVESHPEGFC